MRAWEPGLGPCPKPTALWTSALYRLISVKLNIKGLHKWYLIELLLDGPTRKSLACFKWLFSKTVQNLKIIKVSDISSILINGMLNLLFVWLCGCKVVFIKFGIFRSLVLFKLRYFFTFGVLLSKFGIFLFWVFSGFGIFKFWYFQGHPF